MTLSEYIRNTSFIRFAPELVNTEEKKCRRFEKGCIHRWRLVRVAGEAIYGKWGMASGRQGSQNGRDRGTFQLLIVSRVRAPFSTGLGDTRRDHRHCHQCGQEGHIRAHCPQTPSQLRLLHHRVLRHQFSNEVGSEFWSASAEGYTESTTLPLDYYCSGDHRATMERVLLHRIRLHRSYLIPEHRHSFIAASFVLALGLETEELNPPLFVDTPIGGRMPLEPYMSGGGCLEFFGERQESFEPYLYEPRDKGSIAYLLASLTLDEDLSTRGELPRVVCDFPDIFPEELPGLPPEREVEFTIDLLRANVVADALSRKPASLWSLVIEEWRMVRDLGFYALHCEELSEGVTLCNLMVHSTLLTRVVDAQQDDEETGYFRTKFLSGEASEGPFPRKVVCANRMSRRNFTRVPPFSFSCTSSYQSSIEMAPYEALYGRPCRSPVCWTELGEATVVGPELVAETAESMVLIRKRLKAAQKATTEKVKKYEPDPSHVLEWSKLELEADASFEEKPIRAVDFREKVLRGKTIRLVRILWNNFGSEESTWEREDEMREKYPNLFAT
ncbi:hypothetical protein Acr_07g0010500 [Actinidia rufa]|uniref:CCHC-type domain-containing protein n=1 Tax=Actinidia rufa TaxID=165716 RepID=A0A7J0EWJ8_9ERIC|nr:hypothetical protein Acr_07g0010500 [Actinidia rufa]